MGAALRIDDLYNAKNQLVQANTVNGVLGFAYDINGIRNAKTVDGVTTYYITDSNRDYAQVLVEMQNGAITKTYTYGNDLVSQTAANDASYYLYDGLGSTRALADESGAITDQYEYSAYGNILNTVGNTANAYRYTGEQLDENIGQYVLRARNYSPVIGRFTTEDTYQGRMQEPVTLHKYLYANGNPVSFTDPSGNNATFGVLMSALTVADIINGMAIGGFVGVHYAQATMMGNTVNDLKIISARNKVRNEVDVKASQLAAILAIESAKNDRSPHMHHTIPEYMCGAHIQKPNMVQLNAGVHSKLHTALSAYAVFIDNIYGAAFDSMKPIFSTNSAQNKSGLKTLAGQPIGRQFIVGHLDIFYSFGWYDAAPDFKTKFNDESALFIKNLPKRTGLPNCKKP